MPSMAYVEVAMKSGLVSSQLLLLVTPAEIKPCDGKHFGPLSRVRLNRITSVPSLAAGPFDWEVQP